MNKKIIKRFFISLITICLLVATAFYVLIICGVSKRLQTIWVCTAMTTMNHKYLATWFIPEETINQILEENKVDDSLHNSDIMGFTKKDTILYKPTFFDSILSKPRDPSTYHSYYAEGYEKLDSGIFVKKVNGATWTGFVMLVEDPLRVKLVDTAYQFKEGQTVKQMVKSSGAVAGINGGGFNDGANYDSNGGNPAGLIIENGTLVNPTVDDETVYNMIGINKNGVLILRHCTAQWAMDNNIVSAVSFSPFIVVNGEGTIKNGTGGWGIAPRTGIGQRSSGEFVFVVVDGRQVGWSIGCDLDVLQEIFLEENVINGAMLDGGSSTVMCYRDEYINKPSLGHERLINNSFVVK